MTAPDWPAPLTEDDVSEAEQQLGISLPDAYREYLLTISAGGAVARLAHSERGWWWEGNERLRRDLVSVPFPHPDSYAEADEALDDREPQAANFPDRESFVAAWRAWDDECGEFQAQKTAGCVIAQEHGCNFKTLLVLSGPLAGTMWWDGRASCDLIVPLSLDRPGGAHPISFRDWLGRSSWVLLGPDWG